MKGTIVIIGASAAGGSAAREVRSLNKDAQVILFSEENHYPYYRPYLTEYIGNSKVKEKSNFFIMNEQWCREQGVVLNLGRKIVSIDTKGKTVTDDAGKSASYERLILACGSRPFVPHPDVLSRKNVFAVRTLDDAEKVFHYANGIARAVIIGGGLLGLEAAHALIGRGIHVTIIELSERLLPNQLDPAGSEFYSKLISQEKLRLVLGKKIASMECDDKVNALLLEGGETVEADMVIYSVGVRSNIGVARDAGIEVNRALVVNEKMETSVPGVYACGDVAEYRGQTVSLWMNAVRQGKVAGANAAGGNAVIGNDLYPAVLNSFGTRIFSVGNICAAAGVSGFRDSVTADAGKGHYRKLFFQDEKLVGFILIGDIAESQKLLNGLKNGISYSECVPTY